MPFTGRMGNGGTRQGSASFSDGRSVSIAPGGNFSPWVERRIVGISRLTLLIYVNLPVSVLLNVRAALETINIASYAVAANVRDFRVFEIAGRQATFVVSNADPINTVTLRYIFAGTGAS